MTTENAMFGAVKKQTGKIGFCDLCHNKAELHGYQGMSTCEDCIKLETATKQSQLPVITNSVGYVQGVQPDDMERLQYIKLLANASEILIDKVIKGLVKRKVFHMDFTQLIQNPRWFTVLDLKKLAAEIALPAVAIAPEPEPIVQQEEIKKKPRRKYVDTAN